MDRYKRGFGLNLVDALQGRKQAWLADQLGVKPSTVSRWVNGHDHPTEENLEQIAAILNVSLESLTGLTYQGQPVARAERWPTNHGSAALDHSQVLQLASKFLAAPPDFHYLVQAILDDDPSLLMRLSPEFVETLRRLLERLS